MNSKRKIIFEKTNGRCFYCGCNLPKTGWHADHFHPIVRRLEDNRDKNGVLIGYKTGKDCLYPELDTIENLVPACAPCNNFKHSLSIEGYRRIVSDQFKNVLKNSTGLRQLERLGLIDIKEKPILFWYEKNNIEAPDEFKIIGISDAAKSIEWKKDNSEPDYYYHEFEGFICSLRRIGDYWLAIAMGYGWNELGRKQFPNGRHVKPQVAEWAIRLKN